jgi:hypothetical protein
MDSDEKLVETTPEIEAIEVDESTLPKGCRVDRLCIPEEVFEMIELCKLCGRWV